MWGSVAYAAKIGTHTRASVLNPGNSLATFNKYMHPEKSPMQTAAIRWMALQDSSIILTAESTRGH